MASAVAEEEAARLGQVAYEEFQRQVGHDPARLPWNSLDSRSGVRETWIAVARAVLKAKVAGR